MTSDKKNKKPQTRWLLVLGIILFLTVFWWAPVLLSLIGVTPPASPDPGGQTTTSVRHVEPDGGFSFVPPAGWQLKSHAASKFKAVIGPPTGGFAPNIVVLGELYPGSVQDYVAAGLPTIVHRPNEKDAKVLKQEAFATVDGMNGVRVILERGKDRLLRQTVYFFGTGDKKFVINCTTVAEGGETLDALFEDSVKTFRLDPNGGDRE